MKETLVPLVITFLPSADGRVPAEGFQDHAKAVISIARLGYCGEPVFIRADEENGWHRLFGRTDREGNEVLSALLLSPLAQQFRISPVAGERGHTNLALEFTPFP